jgi:hypothetical protein
MGLDSSSAQRRMAFMHTRGTARQRQLGSCVKGTRRKFVRTPFVGRSAVQGERIQVSTRSNKGRQCTTPSHLCACISSATQGPRRCTFSRVGSASGTGCARLRHRASGTGFLAGAATGGSRAAGSVDVMLHGTRRRCDVSRVWVHRWWQFHRCRHAGAEHGGIGGRRPRLVVLGCQRR